MLMFNLTKTPPTSIITLNISSCQPKHLNTTLLEATSTRGKLLPFSSRAHSQSYHAHTHFLMHSFHVWNSEVVHPMALSIAYSALGVSPTVVRVSPSRDLRPFNGRTTFLLKSPLRIIDKTLKRIATKARAEVQASEDGTAAIDMTQFKHVLLPIIDKNPYLTEGTKQAAATTTALAKTTGAKITVIVVDENAKDAIADYDTRLSSIRWHLAEGGFEEFGLIERLGKGNKPTAVVGEIADDMDADLVVLSMESIHLKHVDGNLLAEFIPCPVLLLPL